MTSYNTGRIETVSAIPFTGASSDSIPMMIGCRCDFDREVGLILKEIARKRSVSCISIARQTGIPRSTVTRYLNAQSPIPLYAFILICRILDCSISSVIGKAISSLPR